LRVTPAPYPVHLRLWTRRTVLRREKEDPHAAACLRTLAGGAVATISTSTIRDNDYIPNTFFACGLLFFDANGVNDDTNIYLNNEKDKCGAQGRDGTYEGAP
jgi:hypothetical protein